MDERLQNEKDDPSITKTEKKTWNMFCVVLHFCQSFGVFVCQKDSIGFCVVLKTMVHNISAVFVVLQHFVHHTREHVLSPVVYIGRILFSEGFWLHGLKSGVVWKTTMNLQRSISDSLHLTQLSSKPLLPLLVNDIWTNLSCDLTPGIFVNV